MSEFPVCKRAVFLSGLLGDGYYDNGIKNALASVFGYDDVEVFSLPQAHDNNRALRIAAFGAEVYTHSAGALGVKGLLGEAAVHMIAAPTRAPFGSPLFLIPRWLRDNQEPGARAAKANKEIIFAEDPTLRPQNPGWQLRQVFSIAKFDRVEAAREMQNEGILVDIAAMRHDDFFPTSAEERARAARAGIELVVLNGEHAELAWNPVPVLEEWKRKTHHGLIIPS